MDCRDFIERHSELVDGALALDESARLRRHAASCDACARYDNAVRRGGELVREVLPRVDASPDFEPRLRHRLFHVRDDARRRSSGLFLTLTLALVAATAAGLAVTTIGRPAVPVVHAQPMQARPPALVGPATPVRMPGAPAVQAGNLVALESDVRWPVYSPADYAAEFRRPAITPVVAAARRTAGAHSLVSRSE